MENIYEINNHKSYDEKYIKEQLKSLEGNLTYLPPKYSAKRINGKRAYEMARSGIDFELKKVTSKIFDVKFINYCHPFISFDISVSEGSYIRSISQELLSKIGASGTLSYLERLNEGKFFFEEEKELNPLEYLDLQEIKYSGSKEWVELGKKILFEYLEHNKLGTYTIVFDDFFSIIEIKEEKVSYVINRIKI